jgi:hypothetical protein
MRLINKICRSPFAFGVAVIFAIIAYVVTIAAMLFDDWDKEFASLKTIHEDIGDFFVSMLGVSK